MCPIKDLQSDKSFDRKNVDIKKRDRYASNFFETSKSLNRLKSALKNIFRLNKPSIKSTEKKVDISARNIEENSTTSKTNKKAKETLNKDKYPKSLFLKTNEKYDEEITLEDFLSPFDFSITDYENIFKIFKDYLPKELNISFAKAKSYKEKLEEIIETDVDERKKALKEFAKELRDAAANLEKEEPLILFGKLSKANKESKIVPLIVQFLPKKFGIPKNIRNIDVLLDLLKKRLITNFDKEIQNIESLKSMTEEIEKIFHSTSKVIDCLPQSWREPFKNSLKEDIKELLLNKQTEGSAESFAEKFFDEMLEKGLTKVLETASTTLIEKIYEIANKQSNSLIDIITTSLPKETQEILNFFNFHEMDENFWIEIQKQNNGKYKLLIFSKETSFHNIEYIDSEKGVSIPLIFSDIDREKINESFFTRILSYETLPKWNEDTKYDFNHFLGDLINYFQKAPDPMTKSTQTKENNYLSNNENQLYETFFKFHLYDDEETYESILFEIRKEAFVHFFSKILKNKEQLKNPKILNSLKKAKDILANQAKHLAENKLLTDNEFLEIFDTIEHFNKVIRLEEKPSQKIPSSVLPKEMAKILHSQFTNIGLTKNHVYALKNALMEIFGRDLERPIEYLIQEIEDALPEEILTNNPKPSSSSSSIDLFISSNSLINQLKGIIPKRLSLLHIYRTITNAINLIYTTSEYIVLYNITLSLLMQFAPIMPYLGMISIIVTFIIKNSPKLEDLIKTVLPEDILAIVYFLKDFINEVKSFLSKKILTLFLKIFIPKILGKENLKVITTSLEKFQQQITREGKLSFECQTKKCLTTEKKLTPAPLQSTSYLRRQLEEITIIDQRRDIDKESFPVEISPVNYETLDEKGFEEVCTNWLENFRKIFNYQKIPYNDMRSGKKEFPEFEKAIWYLNEKVLSLPIPSNGKSDFWDKIPADKALNLLHPIIIYYMKLNYYNCYKLDDQNTQIAQFTLYTIIDYLARKDQNAHLTDFKTSSLEIIIWMQNPRKNIINPKTYAQFSNICDYFKIDKNKRYSIEEIKTLYKESNFLDFPDNQMLSRYDSYSTSIGKKHNDNRKSFWKYFDILLKDSIVQKKIQLYYKKDNPTKKEQYFCLFKDPSLKNMLSDVSADKLKHLFKKNEFRKGILPSSFYILRLSNLMINGACLPEGDDEVNITFKRNSKWNSGLERFDKVLDTISNKFHKWTWEFFKEYKIYYNFEYSFSDVKRFLSQKTSKDTFKSLLIEDEYIVSLYGSKKLIDIFPRLENYYKPMESQDEILAEHNLKKYNFFNMIVNYKNNQFMRALGYFQENYTKLNDHTYQEAFAIFCNNIHALHIAISKSNSPNIDIVKSIVKPIGDFFKKTIDYYISIEDVKTTLFLLNLGNQIKNKCNFKYKNCTKHFPNFREILLKNVLPKNLDKLPKIYACLLSFYEDLSPDDLSEEERKHAIIDIARFKYNKKISLLNILIKFKPLNLICIKKNIYKRIFKWPIFFNYIQMIKTTWRFSPLIEKTIKKDPSIRKTIIENILNDSETTLPDKYNLEQSSWEGTFPTYQLKGTKFLLTLEEKENENHDLKIKQDSMKSLLPGFFDLRKCIKHSQNNFYFPGSQIYVQLSKDKKRYIISRILKGKKYYLYIPSFAKRKNTFWIEKTKEKEKNVIYFKYGIYEWEKKCFCSNNEDELDIELSFLNETIIDGKVYKKFDINSFENISLLSWFESLDRIQYVQEKDNEENEKIIFDDYDLSFSLKKDKKGHKKAYVDKKFPGFYIATRQKNKSLYAYPQTLILKNDKKEKKVLIPKSSIEAMFLSFSSKYLTNFSSSTLLENLIHNFLNEKNEGYFHFDLSKNNILKTKDPEALTYLVAFHIMNGHYQKAKYYLEKVEAYGNQHQFTEKMYKYFDMLTIPFLLLKDEAACEIALKISSIKAKNLLLKGREKKKEGNIDFSKEIPFFVIEYILIQTKYASYIPKIKSEKTIPYLTEYDELFLIKTLERTNNKILKKILLENENEITKFINYFRINNFIARTIMHPNILERAQILDAKHLNENSTERVLKNALTAAMQGFSSPPSKINSLGMETSLPKINFTQESMITKIVQTSFKALKNPFFSLKKLENKDLNEIIKKLDSSMDLKNIPIDIADLTPQNIIKYFPVYCLLASGQIEENLNNEDKKLFIEKSRLFRENLLLCSGNYDRITSKLFFILKSISKSNFSSKDIVDRLLKVHQLQKSINDLIALRTSDENQLDERLKNLYKIKYQTKVREKRAEKKVLLTKLNKLIGSSKKKILYNGIFSKDSFKLISNTALNIITNYGAWATSRFFGLSPIFYAYKGVNLARYTYRAYNIFQKISSVTAMPKSIENEPIFEDDSFEKTGKVLDQRDKKIDDLFDKLLDKYFIIEKTVEDNDEKKVPLPLPEKEFLKDAIKEINQSLSDFYNRPIEEKTSFKLKENLSKKQFISETKDLLLKFQNILEKEKNELLQLVNPPKKAYSEKKVDELISEINQVHSRKTVLTYKDLILYFAHNAEEELIKKGFVKDKKSLKIVIKKLYKILVLQSRLGIFHKIEINEKNIDQLAQNLHRKRVYDFITKPDKRAFQTYEKLLKGKLLFEAGLNVMLWEKPMKALDNLLSKEKLSQVVEAIMGSGKSFFFIPEASYLQANKKQIVFDVWPAPVANENKDSLAKQMKKAFSIQAKSFECSRTTKWTISKLWALKTQLNEALEKKQPISTTKEDMQSLELLFIEMILDIEKKFEKKASWKTQLELMKDILVIIRKIAKVNIDETHEQFNPKKELNFPIGRKKHINKNYAEIIRDIMLLLSSIPEIDEIVQTKAKKPKTLKKETYDEKVLPLLADRVVHLRKLDIPDEHKNDIKKYIMGKSKFIPTFVSKNSNELKSLLGLVKGVLTVILPKSLENLAHVNYALSKESEDQFAKPSEGNENPSETSTIRNPFEALIKTMLIYYKVGLSDDQISFFLRYLRETSQIKARALKCSKYDTTEALFFKKLFPKINLFNIPHEMLDEIKVKMKKNDQVTLTYISWVICKEIKYFAYNLTSDPQNFASMFALDFLSYTGTPYNSGCFPNDTEIQYDKGTTGESIDIISKQEKKNPKAIDTLYQKEPKKVLNEILERFIKTNPKTSAIIDRGALFAGMNNEAIAREILLYATKEKLNIEGVVFYNQKKKLVIIEKGASHPIPLKLSKLKESERFTYFDECHTYAADISQDKNAEGIVTIGEKTTLEGFCQAIWRMRGLKKASQTLKFLVPEKLAKMISKNNILDLTSNELFQYLTLNEQELLMELNFEADKQKLHDIIRRAILDKAIFAPSIDETRAIMLEYQNIFVTKLEEDPFKIYGYIDTYISPFEFFQSLKQKLSNIIKSSEFFTKEEKEEILLQLEPIGKGKYPTEIHTYQNEKEEITASDSSLDIGKESQIAEAENEEAENEEEEEEEVELQIEQNQMHKYRTLNKINRPSFYPWPKDFAFSKFKNFELSPIKKDSIFSFLTNIVTNPFKRFRKKEEDLTLPVPVFSVKEAIKSYSSLDLQIVADNFSENLCASTNFLQLYDSNYLGRFVEPFGPDQKPIFEVLIIQHKNTRKIILIDQQEAHFFKEKLKEEMIIHPQDRDLKICVYDVENGTYVSARKNGFSEEVLNSYRFKLEMTQLKFLGGFSKYSDEELLLLKDLGKKAPYKMEKALKLIHENLKESTKVSEALIESFFEQNPSAQSSML